MYSEVWLAKILPTPTPQCMCVLVCVYVCVFVCDGVCVCMCVSVFVFVYVCDGVCASLRVYVCLEVFNEKRSIIQEDVTIFEQFCRGTFFFNYRPAILES